MRRGKQLKRTAFLRRAGKQRPKPGVPKGRVNDEPEYRAFVKQHPCCVCVAKQLEPQWPFIVDPAHTHIFGAEGSGSDQKPDDRTCVPLCRGVHHHEHDHGRNTKTFWQDYGLDPAEVAIELNLRYDGTDIRPRIVA